MQAWVQGSARLGYFVADWILTTNHRRLAILYFAFVAVTGFTGLILATVIRLELAYPGQFFLAQNAERYLTVISLHGIVMVFFVVIPVLFGAFGNFLLPTQLGIRDVAFPRLNSFMFWVTPAGFVMLLHILLFDKVYSTTSWLNYAELQARLRRRFHSVENSEAEFRSERFNGATLGLRLRTESAALRETRGALLHQYAPQLTVNGPELQAVGFTTFRDTAIRLLDQRGILVIGIGQTASQVGTWFLRNGVIVSWCEASRFTLGRGEFMGLSHCARWVIRHCQAALYLRFHGFGDVMRVAERLVCLYTGMLETTPL